MKNFLNALGISTMLLFICSFSSDFYSSITKVDYIEGGKMLKFTTKIDTEHLSSALKLDPGSAHFENEAKKYINNRFDVSVNGSEKPLTFTGSQVKGESIWVYFEANNISDISNLKIRNSILLDVFPKQLNMVNVAYKGIQKNMTFQRGKEIAEISF